MGERVASMSYVVFTIASGREPRGRIVRYAWRHQEALTPPPPSPQLLFGISYRNVDRRLQKASVIVATTDLKKSNERHVKSNI